ncbi:MAG: hypothetical protein H0V45_11810, partial [Actinobacteria bacterium]|nr:hypothetical protein [Actinomycetota bacterium]
MSFAATLRRIFPTRPVRAVLVGLVVLAFAAAASGGSTVERWQAHAPLPEPRTEVAAGLAGDQIVVVGGFVEGGGSSARADGYSIASDRWSRLPDLPASVDHAAAASAVGRVYVLGGYGADRRPLRSAFVLEEGSWRKLAGLPEPRAAAAAAISSGKLYVVGGVDGTGLARVALAFDLRAGRWSRVPGP